ALIDFIGTLASSCKTNPAILGYEPFNEPNDVGLGRSNLEANFLTPFYVNVLHEIRDVAKDTNSFIFVEPRADWNLYPVESSQTWFSFTSKPEQIRTFLGATPPESFLTPGANHDERAVFSFHFYDPWTVFWAEFGYSDNMATKQRIWPAWFHTMIASATNRNLIPFLTEFGIHNKWRHFST